MQASSLVASACEDVVRMHADSPVALKTRFNPCQSDEQLKYEVQLYDSWRYVRIIGPSEKLSQFEARARAAAGAPFEAEYEIESGLFTSFTGQKYYKLTVY